MKKLYFLFLACLAIGCTKPSKNCHKDLVYIQIGDSITAGQENTPGHSPGDYAIQALATPSAYIKLGFPGESAQEFNAKHRQQLQDSLSLISPANRLILGIAFGANDLNATPKEKVLENILRITRWATDTLQVKQVLLIPVMNRTDKWGFTREADMSKSQHFNASRLWLNEQLRAATSKMAGVRMAQEADSPTMYRDEAPADSTRFADRVHPLDKGAQELGAGTIAHGLAGFGNIRVK